MLGQEWTNLGRCVVLENKFCAAAPNLFGASAQNLLNIIILAHAILGWLLDFWKRFSPLCYNHINYCYKSFVLKEMNINECLTQSSTMSKKIVLHPPPSQLYYVVIVIIIIIIIIIAKLLSNVQADICSPTVIPASFNGRRVKSAAYCNIIPVFRAWKIWVLEKFGVLCVDRIECDYIAACWKLILCLYILSRSFSIINENKCQ